MKALAALGVIAVLALPGTRPADKMPVTVYFLDGRLSPLGYRGKLSPVERTVSDPGTARHTLLALLAGPTPEEQRRGFISPLAGAELLSLHIRHDRAVVDLAAAAPDAVEPGAQVLYTLTELPGIRRVSVQLNGEACCFWDRQGHTIETVKRSTLRYWAGEPCHLRTTPTHVVCR
jgi:spore germination protein GerM